MRLTTQMLAEFQRIQEKAWHIIYNDFYMNIQEPLTTELEKRKPGTTIGTFGDHWMDTNSETRRKINDIIEQLNPFKVRLENILCETDIKERVHVRYF